MDSKKILFITQEIAPFLTNSTPLTEFSKNIPEAVQKVGLDLRVFTPCYGTINERRNQLHDVIRLSGINIAVNDMDHPLLVKVASIPESHLQVYFVDNDEFFKRKSKFKPDAKYTNTNIERSVFFIRGAFEAIHKLRWVPDIIHCVGWFAGLAPLYLRSFYKDSPCLGKAKIIYSTAGEEEEGEMGDNLDEIMDYDKIPKELWMPSLEELTPRAIRKLGIMHADGVSLVAHSESEVEEYATFAKSLDKPMIMVAPEEDAEGKKHSEFYRSIL